jgi:hypothetical protein
MIRSKWHSSGMWQYIDWQMDANFHNVTNVSEEHNTSIFNHQIHSTKILVTTYNTRIKSYEVDSCISWFKQTNKQTLQRLAQSPSSGFWDQNPDDGQCVMEVSLCDEGKDGVQCVFWLYIFGVLTATNNWWSWVNYNIRVEANPN